MNLDPVTLEVLRHRLDSIADNMEATLIRTAYSSIIKEGGDCSVALFDVEGNTVAQGLALPVHLGSMPPAVKALLARFPPHTLKHGDMLAMNDPYSGGQHNPDLIVLTPVIVDGETVALAVSLAHHQDVGGRTPGSNPTDATDVFEEGLCIPPLKLVEGGQIVEPIEAFIRANVRRPDLLFGDLAAQMACGTTAARELAGLFRIYGRAVMLNAMSELLARAEQLTRKFIAQIPDGTYRFTDWLDNDGLDLERRINITAAVTVSGSNLHVDFAGTSPQVRGPFNAVPSCALSAVRYCVRAISDPEIPNNEGCYRMISIDIPPRSLLNPSRPAPVNCRSVALRRVVDTVMGALAQALPGRIPAANNGHPLNAIFGGDDPRTGQFFILTENGTGGMGARPTKDGIDCICTDTSNSMNVPVEVVESTTPLRITHFRIRRDSGGAGRYRGGNGFDKEYLCLAERVVVSHRGERHFTQPWGLQGGAPGAPSRSTIVRADGRTSIVPSKQTIELGRGDRLILETTGGGGYGDPMARPAEFVLADVLDGKVSVQAARDLYGVVVDGESISFRETVRLRDTARARETAA
jgi:N-methylhydantoinase B